MKNLISIFLLFTLFACNTIKEGVVVDKHYEDADIYPMMVPMAINGSMFMTTYMIYDNPDYVLTVQVIEDGYIKYYNVFTSRECYYSLDVGDYWYKTDSCSFTDDNNQKRKQ